MNLGANNILDKLMDLQRSKLDPTLRLEFKDMKRMTKYIDNNFFNENECCIWQYVNKKNNKNYITFYFKEKKVSLYRLLYYNFIDDINSNEYIKLKCNNIGKCCNIYHLNKYKYNDQK
jgi:hypothetical protein